MILKKFVSQFVLVADDEVQVGEYTAPDHCRGTNDVAHSLIARFGRAHNV